MAYRLFQNSSKTQPITEAGVSVGYSERKQGTVDALQATTLSKPLLGRWPKGGVRNLANGGQAVDNSNYWPLSQVSGGVTITRVGSGFEGGIPYVDLNYSGTVSIANGQVIGGYLDAMSALPAESGDRFVASMVARLIDGVAPAEPSSSGIRIQVEGRSTGLAYVEGSASAGYKLPVDGLIARDHLMTSAETVSARVRVILQALNGAVINCTYRVKGLQLERGGVQTPLQFNYGPNNITEPGVEDEWFLYNDGNDSLNTQPLQSGDYSVTSVDIYGNMDNKPIVNSSGGSINSLVKERQRDVIVRSPPLIPSELEQVQAYWKAKGYKTEWSPLLLMSTQTDGHWSRGYNPNID